MIDLIEGTLIDMFIAFIYMSPVLIVFGIILLFYFYKSNKDFRFKDYFQAMLMTIIPSLYLIALFFSVNLSIQLAMAIGGIGGPILAYKLSIEYQDRKNRKQQFLRKNQWFRELELSIFEIYKYYDHFGKDFFEYLQVRTNTDKNDIIYENIQRSIKNLKIYILISQIKLIWNLLNLLRF